MMLMNGHWSVSPASERASEQASERISLLQCNFCARAHFRPAHKAANTQGRPEFNQSAGAGGLIINFVCIDLATEEARGARLSGARRSGAQLERKRIA